MEEIKKFNELKTDTEKLERMLEVYSMLHAEHTKLEADFATVVAEKSKVSQELYKSNGANHALIDQIQELSRDKEVYRKALEFFIDEA